MRLRIATNTRSIGHKLGARKALIGIVFFLSVSTVAQETLIETDFYKKQQGILRDTTASAAARTAALRNVEWYCWNAGNWQCVRESVDLFLEDGRIQAASTSSEKIANALRIYETRKLLYSEDDYQKFSEIVLGDEFNSFILNTLRDLYVANSTVRVDAIYAIMNRAIAHGYRVASNGQGTMAEARDQYLYALGLVLSLDPDDHDHYMILNLVHQISIFLRNVGESALSNRLDQIFMPSLFSLGEQDPHLLSDLVIKMHDDLVTPPAVQPEYLLEQIESFQSRWDSSTSSGKVAAVKAEVCARLNDKICVLNAFNTAMAEPNIYSATEILRTWMKYFEPARLPFPEDDVEKIKQHLIDVALARDEEGRIGRLSEDVSRALVTDLHYLGIKWSSPEFGEGELKDKYYFQAILAEVRKSAVDIPWQGLSLPTEAQRRLLIHGLMNYSNIELDGAVFEVPQQTGTVTHVYTKEAEENTIFFAHDLLQSSIGSRAASTRIYAQESDKPSEREARKKLVLRSNEWFLTLLKASTELAKAIGRDPRFDSITIDDRDYGRIALKMQDVKHNPLYKAAGVYGKVHGGIQDYRAKLDEKEAVVISVKAGNLISTVCLRNSDLKHAAVILDPAEFKLHTRLLGLSLTATHSPNISMDTQFPFSSAHYLYRKIFEPISDCLLGVEQIFYSTSLELNRIPPIALVSQMPKQRLSDGLGAADWLAKSYVFQILDAPDEFLLRSEANAKSPRPSLFLGVAGHSGEADGAAIAAFRGAPLEAGTQLAPLPNVAREVSSIAKILGEENSTVLVREQAAENVVKAELEMGYRYASFATHALVSGEITDLRESAILLSKPNSADGPGDGLLLASEIAGLSINTDYISLSACNTATFNESAFEENIQGLSNAFKYAGVSEILSTLWPVETNIAETINVSTFKHIIEFSKPPATALSDSIRAVLVDSARPEYQHPRFWGAFKVSGM